MTAFHVSEGVYEGRHMFSEMYSVRDCNETLPREHMITGLGNSKARRLDVNGAGTRSRTRDLLITSQLLYHKKSYTYVILMYVKHKVYGN